MSAEGLGSGERPKAGRMAFVVGHRGAPSLAPENTVPSFLRAIEAGADFIEVDVWRTDDGEVVVIHDSRVDRTTDSEGPVSELKLMELKTLDAGGWFAPKFRGVKVPTLEEALAVIKDRASVVVHIKETGVEENVIGILREKDMVHDSIIIADTDRAAVRIKELEPKIPIQADMRLPLKELSGMARGQR